MKPEKKNPTPSCDIAFNEVKANLGYMIEKLFLFGYSEEEIQKIERKARRKRMWGSLVRKIGLGK